MKRFTIGLILALLVTAASIALWAITDSHYYTKYEVVEKVEKKIESNDPLAQTGFYDEESKVVTEHRDEFHFGLLPTPSGLIDKHMFSVLSIIFPFWIAVGILFYLDRSKLKKAMKTAETKATSETSK